MSAHIFKKLLDTLSLQDILFLFKDRWFAKLTPYSPESRAVIQDSTVLTLLDDEILKTVLPDEIFKSMFGQGNKNLLAFVFALRHKILYLQFLLHIQCLHLRGQHQAKQNLITTLSPLCLEQEYEKLEPLLQPSFWKTHQALPVIGFSSVGCHFLLRNVFSCRSFDFYENTNCSALCKEKVFCSEHILEEFWTGGETLSPRASTQAHLAFFYLKLENFNSFSEENLIQMIEEFWKKIYFQDKSSTLEEIKMGLFFYGFESLDELRHQGLIELRKRFLEKAKVSHPDVGGGREAFHTARQNYECLKGVLEE
jgi:hypothetical protein